MDTLAKNVYLIGILGFIGGYILSFFRGLTSSFIDKYTASCIIKEDEPEHKALEQWIEAHSGYRRYELKHKKLVSGRGYYWFWYQNRILFVTKADIQRGSNTDIPAQITLSIPLGTKGMIQSIIDECNTEVPEVHIYQSRGDYWHILSGTSGRKLETVTMNPEIIKDARKFFDERTKEHYKNLGVPYRRGYLFYGPPGTGKTSACLAIATELGLDLQIISNTVSDANLLELMTEVKPRSMVVIEDIDRMFNDEKRLSMSGLLNAIDGILESDGRLLIITTNNKDSLDNALIRPGRCDRHFEFNDLEPGNRLRKLAESII